MTGTLDQATVLVIGAGDIGQAVADRLEPFGCRLLRVARRARYGVEAVEALRGCCRRPTSSSSSYR